MAANVVVRHFLWRVGLVLEVCASLMRVVEIPAGLHDAISPPQFTDTLADPCTHRGSAAAKYVSCTAPLTTDLQCLCLRHRHTAGSAAVLLPPRSPDTLADPCTHRGSAAANSVSCTTPLSTAMQCLRFRHPHTVGSVAALLSLAENQTVREQRPRNCCAFRKRHENAGTAAHKCRTRPLRRNQVRRRNRIEILNQFVNAGVLKFVQ